MKVFGFAAYSGNRKTTLIENLVPLLVERGLTISVVKIAALATDARIPTGLPRFGLEDYAGIADFMLKFLRLA